MNTHKRRRRALTKGDDHANVAQRPDEKCEIDIERDKIADRQLTRQNAMTTDTQHPDSAERGQNINCWHEVAANLGGLHRLFVNIVGFFRKFVELHLFGTEPFDHSHTRD